MGGLPKDPLQRRCKTCGRQRPLAEFPICQHRPTVLRRHECVDCFRCRHNGYYLKNHDHRLETAKKRYAQQPFQGWSPERRAQLNAANKRRRAADRELVLWHYGARCACCGEAELIFLTVDHVNDDGAAHRRHVQPGRLHRWIIRNGFPEAFQILCYNCNCGRARNGGLCPHEQTRLHLPH